MYYEIVHDLARKVLDYIRRHDLLRPGDRTGVAVSGGADSVALLRLLLHLRQELGVVLSVVHFNHRLRGAESDADERFVSTLAREHKLELYASGADVGSHAAEKHVSIEAAGRELRYGYFRQLLEQGRLTRVATAHTLDDQAETVLLRLVRGAGTRGLAGIYPQLSVTGSQFSVIRPLLGVRRSELYDYMRASGQPWREDASNRDLRFARNRVRHGILPRLERNLNPAVRQVLAETAEIARAEEEYWKAETARCLAERWDGQALRISTLPLALQRRVVRAAGELLGPHLDFQQVEQALALATGDCMQWPDGWRVARDRDVLRFRPAAAPGKADYEYRLSVPGQVVVPGLGVRFEAVCWKEEITGYNRDQLLDAEALGNELIVRNWRAGDRFWPAHTKAARKVKELLQQRHITGAQRQSWPVVVSGVKVVWLRGFATPAELQPGEGARLAILIREKAAK